MCGTYVCVLLTYPIGASSSIGGGGGGGRRDLAKCNGLKSSSDLNGMLDPVCGASDGIPYIGAKGSSA